MAEIQCMEELNIPSNMKNVIMKWPYRLRDSWRSTVCELQERRGHRATFPDMVNFLETQVKILFHPLFGDITDAQPNTLKAVNKSRPLPRSSIKGSSFATNISATGPNAAPKPTVSRSPRLSSASKEPHLEFCLYCKEPHLLPKCLEA